MQAKAAAALQTQAVSPGAKIVMAATVGNILEIYDWAIFSIFAVPISKTFFPTYSDTAAILLTLATMALGAVVRPFGAVILGRYADRIGRRQALSVTLLMMGIGILISAACPGYASIGIAAPIIVVIGRMLQGFSAGAEVGCSLTVLVESASPRRRRLFASLQQASQGAGILLAGGVGVILTYIFTDQQMASGGWRLAFCVGLAIVPIGIYLRRAMAESGLEIDHRTESVESGWSQAFKYRSSLVYGVFIVLFWTVGSYASNYFTVYAVRELHLPMGASYLGQAVVGLIAVIGSPVVGILAGRIGTRKPMLFGSLATVILAYPLLKYLTLNPSVTTLLFVQAVQGILVTCFAVGASAELVECFPKEFRATGSSVAYTVAVSAFGSVTPLLITALIGFTGNKLVFAFYLAAAAFISTVAILVKKAPSAGKAFR